MNAPRIPTWQERLRACFRYRHRLLHVFGAPSALGAATAVGSAVALNPDTGLALGALTALTGVLLAGYYVVAGFDRKLVARLQAEAADRHAALAQDELNELLSQAEPDLCAQLTRVLELHATIEAVFTDGIDDAVEAVLQNSRKDLDALRQRALAMARLHHRLNVLVLQSKGSSLTMEAKRMDKELERMGEGAGRNALLAAREAVGRAIEQWRSALDKQAQVRNVLSMIENNFQEFKLAMELRKADAALGAEFAGSEVSELQQRLLAAGAACDELVGRNSSLPAQRSAVRR